MNNPGCGLRGESWQFLRRVYASRSSRRDIIAENASSYLVKATLAAIRTVDMLRPFARQSRRRQGLNRLGSLDQ